MVSEYAGGSGGRGREVVRVVSDISNALMNEVSKVIIENKKIFAELQLEFYPTETCFLKIFQGLGKQC